MATITANKEQAMNTFEIGKTYETRSTCDHDCIFSWTVIKRSAKFITVEGGGRTKRVGVNVDADGVEWALPAGSFSMAPVIRASRDRV